jgi:NAD(P)-dependent dehydrogenase (short-subunit alcohol dehydrogenase family)
VHHTHYSYLQGGFMASSQVILITGSSTGFGRLFAETLSRHGHTVFASMRDPGGRNAQYASDLRSLAERESLHLHVLELDVTDDASVERAVRTVVDHSGGIDVAINNAGYGLFGLTEAVTTEQARQLMDTNFFGSVRVNRAVLPHMRRQRSGLLMYISSGAGRVVIPTMGFYCASKFALEALAEAYSYELAGQGIESVIVEPGAYQTAVFGNSVVVADASRAGSYGAVNQFADKIGAALAKSAGNAQDVADVLLHIIDTPAGQRQLRYRVSAANFGVDEINDLSANVQARFLEAFGLSADTKFVQRKTAGAG